MNTSIKRFDPAAEFLIPEGCHITELSNSNDDPDVSIAQARVESGVMTELHWLENVWERYVILAGQGEVEVGSEPFSPVGPGDVVLIPPGCHQRIRNSGSSDLVFLAICSPRFTPDCYHSH